MTAQGLDFKEVKEEELQLQRGKSSYAQESSASATPQRATYKLDLNEFQRSKLQEILRQVAHQQFLNVVTQIEQTDIEL